MTGSRARSYNVNLNLKIGRRGWMEPNPDGEGYIFIHHPPARSDGECDDCGFLYDLQIDPPPVFRARVLQGGGRCTCIEEQGTEEDDSDIIQLFWAGGTTWEGTRNVRTCCGCGHISMTISGTGASRTASMTLTFNPGCETAGLQSITMPLTCCAGTALQFVGWGDETCDDEVAPCDNVFRIVVECEECLLANAECDLCPEGVGPAVWKIAGSGFSGAAEVYNLTWLLQPISSCTWEYECAESGVTVTFEVTATDYVVTFAGGGGGGAVYSGARVDLGWQCFQPFTLDRDSGSVDDTPATIDIDPLYCDRPDVECEAISEDLRVDATSEDNACIDGWGRDLTQVAPGAWQEDNTVNPCGADNGFYFNCTAPGGLPTYPGTWNNCALELVSFVESPLSWTFKLTGACPPGSVTTGESFFVVTEL